jgi:hypothetical protein
MTPVTTGLTVLFKIGGNILSFKNCDFESNDSAGPASIFNSCYRFTAEKMQVCY